MDGALAWNSMRTTITGVTVRMADTENAGAVKTGAVNVSARDMAVVSPEIAAISKPPTRAGKIAGILGSAYTRARR